MLYRVLIAENELGLTDQYEGYGCLIADGVTEEELQDFLKLSRRFGFALQIVPAGTDLCEGDGQNGNG